MPNKPFITAAFILITTFIAVLAIDSREPPVVVSTNLENLPMEISGFTATNDSFSQAVYDELNADLHVYRHYRSPEGKQVDLYVGYYGTAKGGRTPHNPYACFPSAGWAIVAEHTVLLQPKGYDRNVGIKFLHVRKAGVHNIVLHWYQSAGDKVLATGLQQNIQRFMSRILHNRNDGAFVRISAIETEGNTDQAFEMVKAFSEEILALLPLYWPMEKD